jgi:hypothetical protein
VVSSRPKKGFANGIANGISNATLIALCLTTFALGIALTLTFYRPTEQRPATAVAPVAPSLPVGSAPTASRMVIQPLPIPPSELPSMVLASEIFPAPVRRPRAKAATVRPRPTAATHAEAPAAKPWVDPFAE